ncbi:hypothetical protein B046DRAFT_02472 [Streptomyces sp. LamerLS-316]|uniref:hypothetical protein n=1 Tax=unclassified Streptomyces TaxID=2593676 RepID=UPI000823DA17|nr:MULTISPECIES: hypothetical protein [unclassified Streptomyces]MYQ42658.1 hypothetical protein [Streptomyces sp. SID4921]SCK32162.1 hypothetical protein B046DRAFT_02472 [Streptomyces sp. LamerLS-316]
MADEQHEWLDADAAEMLLRGEPVESVDDHARAEARRLEAALGAVRVPRPAGDELPGEAAVLAAFREASRGGKRAGAAGPTGAAGQQDALHTVRIGAARTAPLRRPRWTRPLRYGLAVSLAGCALGGVAVAGTGMLPAPFGGGGSPAPAASVSAAATPEELGAELPDAGEPPSPLPSTSPGVSGSPSATEVPDGGTAGGVGPTRQDGGGATDRESAGPDTDTGSTQDDTDGREAPGGSSSRAEVLKKSIKACRGYREDTLSQEEKARLLELADGERNLDRFCDRLLGADGDGRGDEDTQGGDGKGTDGGSGGGSLPSIIFRDPAAESTRDDASQDGGNPPPTAGATAGSLSGLSSGLSSVTR